MINFPNHAYEQLHAVEKKLLISLLYCVLKTQINQRKYVLFIILCVVYIVEEI